VRPRGKSSASLVLVPLSTTDTIFRGAREILENDVTISDLLEKLVRRPVEKRHHPIPFTASIPTHHSVLRLPIGRIGSLDPLPLSSHRSLDARDRREVDEIDLPVRGRPVGGGHVDVDPGGSLHHGLVVRDPEIEHELLVGDGETELPVARLEVPQEEGIPGPG
jgi:hypothetical protein